VKITGQIACNHRLIYPLLGRDGYRSCWWGWRMSLLPTSTESWTLVILCR